MSDESDAIDGVAFQLSKLNEQMTSLIDTLDATQDILEGREPKEFTFVRPEDYPWPCQRCEALDRYAEATRNRHDKMARQAKGLMGHERT